MKKLLIIIATFIRWTWKLLTTGSALLVNLFVLLSILFVLSLFAEPEVEVPAHSALVIAPAGEITEDPTYIDPFSRAFNGLAGLPLPRETLLQDILDAIDTAATDDRINMIVLSLAELDYAGLNQLRDIGRAIKRFRETGKQVIAVDDYYGQGAYYLASHADEVFMNPMGDVHIRGFGIFGLYMKELIDRLAINFHVFRVGSHKSAVEPFTRSDMSPEAKEDTAAWLARIWEIFCTDIETNRGLEPGSLTRYVDNLPALLRKAEGSNSKMALAANLVDGLRTREEINQHLIGLVGKGEDSSDFNQIHFNDYLTTLTPSYTETEVTGDRIGIIVARGNIMTGEDMPGQIGSDSLTELIRQAREDDDVKALVLRIDSGGGSAFASELIRQELHLLQQAGKPMVVSMGTMAASGAYWISAGADRILAAEFTLTGSIGIFGIVPTFEGTMAKVGINNDGTGTTRLAGAEDPTRPLSPELSETIQLSVEEGYNRFVGIVAEGRDLPRRKVLELAQGRVWNGSRAIELGLVDQIGDMNDAVAEAARLAGLTDYTPVYIREPFSSGQELLNELGRWSAVLLHGRNVARLAPTPLLSTIRDLLPFLSATSDPTNLYSHCLIPHSAIAF